MDAAQASWRTTLVRIGPVALGVAALAFAAEIPAFFRSPKATLDLIEIAYVLTWLIAATMMTRTVPLRTIAAFWFIGTYAAFIAALVVGQMIVQATGNTTAFSAIVASALEEIAKATPVWAFLFLVARRTGWQTSATDGLVLGYVVGAGFAFHEDAIGRMTSGSGWSATGWSPLLPTLLYQFGRPTLGHDGWTALVGVALGFAALFRSAPRIRLLPLSALVVAILDHGVANWIGREGRNLPALVRLMNALLLNGQLPILALFAGVAAALYVDWRTLRAMGMKAESPPAGRIADLAALVKPPVTMPKLAMVIRILDYMRLRRALLLSEWAYGTRGGIAGVVVTVDARDAAPSRTP